MDEHVGTSPFSLGRTGTGRMDLPVDAIFADAARLPVRLLVDPARLEAVRTEIEVAPGSIDPITVWQVSTDAEEYHLVTGLHRLEAHRVLGRDTIPALVLTGPRQEIARYAAERIPVGPGNWSPWDKAQAHGRAKAILGAMSARQYAEFLGCGRTEISRHLRIHDAFPSDSVMEVLRGPDNSPWELAKVTKERLDELAGTTGTVDERIDGLVAALQGQSDRRGPNHGRSQDVGTRGHGVQRIGDRRNGPASRRGRVDRPPQDVRQTKFVRTPEVCDCGVVPSMPEGSCRWSGPALLMGALIVLLQGLLMLGGVGHVPY